MTENEVNTETIEETSTAEVVNTEKRFSDSEVQKIVQERLKREKESSRKLKEDFEAREQEYSEQIQKYEDVLRKMIESQAKDLPDNFKKLLSRLPVLEQLEFLADEGNKVSKKVIPPTPKTEESKEVQKQRKSIKLF